MRTYRFSASLLAVTVLLALPSYAFGPAELNPDLRPSRELQTTGTDASLGSYRGLGAWVDMFDLSPWARPVRAIERMKAKGVRTLFLQTGNYSSTGAIYHPADVSRFIDAAHDRGMEVVAWYVPSFAKLRKDYRRSKAAINFTTARGDRFDSFALDIEATVVDDIATRNARLRRLSERLRALVGPRYTLGAIVPDSGSTYWPHFPYKSVAKRYDVFLPMAYYTYRTSGSHGVFHFISDNFRRIRKSTGDPSVPIHMIGGIAGDGTRREAAAFVRAVREKQGFGGSFYDFPITTRAEWRELTTLAR